MGHTSPVFRGASQKAWSPLYLKSWNCRSAGEDGVWEDPARKPYPEISSPSGWTANSPMYSNPCPCGQPESLLLPRKTWTRGPDPEGQQLSAAELANLYSFTMSALRELCGDGEMGRRQGQQAYKRVKDPECLQETDKYYLLQGLALILWSRIEVKTNLSLSRPKIPMRGEEGGKSKFNVIQEDLDYKGEKKKKKTTALSYYARGRYCVIEPTRLGTTPTSS